jgi:hypothetical protein
MKSKNSPKKTRTKSDSGANNPEFSANKEDSGIQLPPDSPLNNDGTIDITHNGIQLKSINPSDVDDITNWLDQINNFRKQMNSEISNKDIKVTIQTFDTLSDDVKHNIDGNIDDNIDDDIDDDILGEIIDNLLFNIHKNNHSQLLSPKKSRNRKKK